MESRGVLNRSHARLFLPRLRKRHVPHATRETNLRVVHGRAAGPVCVPARPVRPIGGGPGERSRGPRQGGRQGSGEGEADRRTLIEDGPPDSLREFGLLRASMAGPFRSLTSIGTADHGKEVSLAGWAEDVRNLGGLAVLIVRPTAGKVKVPEKKTSADLFNRTLKVVSERVDAVQGIIKTNPHG